MKPRLALNVNFPQTPDRPVRFMVAIVCAACLVANALPARAEGPPDPEIGYLFPAGGSAGRTVDVRLGIYDGTPDLQYLVFDPRVKLEILGPAGMLLIGERPFPIGQKAYNPEPLPREVPARFHIPADFPPGPLRFQIANANGSSRTGVLIVGGAGEAVEDEGRDGTQRLSELPVTVSGRLLRNEEIDRYVFRAPRSGPITCEFWARRLGSKFGGVIEVHDPAGRLLADAVDSRGIDAAVTFAATAGEEYTVVLHDLDYRGNRSFVYRLRFAAAPRVLAALPAAGRPGETHNIEFIGLGVTTGTAKVERVTRSVVFPAASGLESFEYRLDTPFGTAAPVRLALSDVEETVAPAPAPGSGPVRLHAPAAVTALLDAARREAQYTFEARTGDTWTIRAESRTFAAPLDPALSLSGPDGKEIAANDDLPDTTDAGLEFKAPVDGVYRLVVRDQSLGTMPGADAYRLSIGKTRPDFALTMPQRLGVVLGETTELTVKATRKGTFDEPISLAFASLPEGVSVPAGLVVPKGQSELKIPVKAAADAPTGATLAGLTGAAKINGQTVSRAALARTNDNLAPRSSNELDVSQILVAVLMKPRTRIWPVESDERTVNRGTTHLAILGVERLEGFRGDVLLEMESRQPNKFRQGVLGPDVILPAGQDRILYPCFVPEMLETLDAYRVSVSALVQVADPRGRPRWLVSKMQSTVSVAITVEGGLLKLSSESDVVRLKAGWQSSIPLKLVRSPRVTGPVVIECFIAQGTSGRVQAKPLVVPADREGAEFPITISSDASARRATLVLRATATQPAEIPRLNDAAGATPLDPSFLAHLRAGRLPVVSEIEVPVEIVTP